MLEPGIPPSAPSALAAAEPSPAPAAPPTAAANLVITVGPDIRAQLHANVPPSHAAELVTVLGQVVITALLGVAAPVMTVSAAAAVSFPAKWAVLMVAIEMLAALIAVVLLRRRS